MDYYSAIRADLDDGLGIVALLNGPGELNRIARLALQLVRDVCYDRSLPPVLPVVEPTCVEKASDYAGTYTAGTRGLVREARDEGLILQDDREEAALACRTESASACPIPAFLAFCCLLVARWDRAWRGFTGPIGMRATPTWRRRLWIRPKSGARTPDIAVSTTPGGRTFGSYPARVA